nr:efflux RND transporter permease subunit [Frigidibacter albus]
MLASAPAIFLPEMDAGSTTVAMELPPGATLAETEQVALAATAALKAVPEVRAVLVHAGQSPTGLADPRYATLTVGFTDRHHRAPVSELRASLATALTIPGARFDLLRDGGGREVSAGIRGRDGEATSTAALRLIEAMQAEPMFLSPGSDMPGPKPVLRIVPDRDRDADLGISADTVAETIRLSATGMPSADLPVFLDGPRRIPIRARLAPEARGEMAVIERLAVPLPEGGTIPLAAVASVETGEQTASIRRVQQMRQIEVGTDMAPGFAPSDGMAWLGAYDGFPSGIGLANTGDSENQSDTFTAFAVAMGAGITAVAVVLILLFGSVLAPLTVLAALPLSLCGVGLVLWVAAVPVSLPVVIGILMLMGITTKNSISRRRSWSGCFPDRNARMSGARCRPAGSRVWSRSSHPSGRCHFAPKHAGPHPRSARSGAAAGSTGCADHG